CRSPCGASGSAATPDDSQIRRGGTAASLLDRDRVLVDHGIRQESAAHLLDFLVRRSNVFRLEVDQEQFRTSDALDALESKESEGFVDVVALGVRDAFLESDLDPDSDHGDVLASARAPPSYAFLGASRRWSRNRANLGDGRTSTPPASPSSSIRPFAASECTAPRTVRRANPWSRMTATRRSCRIGAWSARAIARSAAENAAPIRTPQSTGNRTGSGSQYQVSTPSWNAARIAAFVRIFVPPLALIRTGPSAAAPRTVSRIDSRASVRSNGSTRTVRSSGSRILSRRK